MKKILWVLLLGMCVGAVYATEAPESGRRGQMLLRYAPKNVQAEKTSATDEFLKAVRQGNLEYLLKVTDKNLLTAHDKFGNNIFHLAPNASTVQTLAGLVRELVGEDGMLSVLSQLRNERNQFGETPLLRHVNIGIADTFELLYKGSQLASDVRQARLVNKGDALIPTAMVFQGTAIAHSKDNSGRTVAQAALTHCQTGNAPLCRVAETFQTEAPYLF